MAECFMNDPPHLFPGDPEPCKAPVDVLVLYSLGSDGAGQVAHASCIRHGVFLARAVLNYAKDKGLASSVALHHPYSPPAAPEQGAKGRSRTRVPSSRRGAPRAPESPGKG